MEDIHKECRRGYHRSSKAWYAKTLKAEIIEVSFGMYHLDGSTSGDMTMEWIELGGEQNARLKCFEDSWSALSLFDDLIQKMGSVDKMLIQEPEFCKMLDECGFKDLTKYKSLYDRTNTVTEEILLEEEVVVSIPKRLAKELGLIPKQ